MREHAQTRHEDRHAGSMPRFGPGGPGHGLAAGAQRAQDTRLVVKRLWGYLQCHRRGLAAVSVLVSLTTAVGLVTPYLTGYAIDSCIIPGRITRLAMVVGLMIVLYLLQALGMWTQMVTSIRISQEAVRDMRRDLFGKLQVLSLRFFDRTPHGELMSRLTNDIENVSNVLGQSVTQFVGSALAIVGAVGAMLILNWRLALVAFLNLPLVLVITRVIAARTRQGFREQQRHLGMLNSIVEETVTGQRVVKTCRREADAVRKFEGANEKLKSTGTRARIAVGLMGPMMGVSRNLGFAVLAGVGGWFVVKDLATVGTVAAFITYAQFFSRPVMEIANLYGLIQSALAGAERVFAVMDEPPDIEDAPDAVVLERPRGEVEFENVDFGYDEGVPVLRGVSFKALPGQTIALVGPTGAGKTTIINLLTRFYDIDSGCIRIDGHDIRGVNKDSLRRALGIVLQDTFLFSDTVRENIRYGKLDASDAQVEAAAELANADVFIRHLPNGFDTRLSENAVALSQGQRQLLAIARAVLADPAVLILDEATSSVDTVTEMHIQEAMLRLMKGRTSFIIAHRLSTIRRADCILVIDDGQIVERGTHEELLAAQGFYHHLYIKQFGGLLTQDSAAGKPDRV